MYRENMKITDLIADLKNTIKKSQKQVLNLERVVLFYNNIEKPIQNQIPDFMEIINLISDFCIDFGNTTLGFNISKEQDQYRIDLCVPKKLLGIPELFDLQQKIVNYPNVSIEPNGLFSGEVIYIITIPYKDNV